MNYLIVFKAIALLPLILALLVGFTVCLNPRRRRWTTVLLIVAGYYGCAFFTFGFYKSIVRDPPCSSSIAEARSRGCLVSEARFEPMSVNSNGIDLEFNEVWIEEGLQTKPNFLLLPYEKGAGWYYLCFTLKHEPAEHVLFVLEGHEGKGFGWMKGAGWTTVTHNADRIPYPEVFDLHLYIQKSWQDKERFELSIRRP